MKLGRIQPDQWLPIGIASVEPAAMGVIRSTTNLSVVAGPGAGKTELLAQRASFLLSTGTASWPSRILAISFKRDAALTLRNRVAMRCTPADAERFDSLTFDAFAKHLIDHFRPGLPEQWRPTPDYVIDNVSRAQFETYLGSLTSAPVVLGGNAALAGVARSTFERRAVLGKRLLIEQVAPSSMEQWAAHRWWREQLEATPSRLTFSMIGRLAELLLRVNPYLRTSLQLTYSHVSLDEFQDTTHVQYDLIDTAFANTATILTAVGDNKQQIMRWAMALYDAFERFERDFGATLISLRRNYRSTPELVRIQHVIARAIDGAVEEPEARVDSTISDDACAIWIFSNPLAEAAELARFINEGLSDSKLTPRDFVILVRQKPVDYEASISATLREAGLVIRNEARLVGKVALQDLLVEGFVSVTLKLFRIASVTIGVSLPRFGGRVVKPLASLVRP